MQGLADREQAHGDDHDIDAVEKLHHAEGEARLPKLRVEPHRAEQSPRKSKATRTSDAPERPRQWSARAPERDVLRRAEQQRDLGEPGAKR